MVVLFFLFITVFIIFLFIPFPVKIQIKYSNKKFTFKIYNLNITDKIKSIKNNYSLDHPKIENKLSFFVNAIKINSNLLKEIKFKASIKLNINIIYGLEDAAHTALVYGLIPLINALGFKILSKIFIVKQNQIHIKPDFNNFYLKIDMTSIIYISLAKIIYTGILLLKYKQKFKKLNLIHT
ncbi:DUF2953 domain-containing protein [Clostridium sp. WILCCON 0269]|uniref:DUF2953 domain-containing protein n=1 Tax=Candidatus Clostridium eludens TaxID=3381663 RepID=A0ABW8SKH2_9CLOT